MVNSCVNKERYRFVRVYRETYDRARRFSEEYNVELIKVFDLAMRVLEKILEEVREWPRKD